MKMDIRDINIKDNNRSYTTILMLTCFVIGLIVGKIVFYNIYSNMQSPIYYISQEEILNLEKGRVSNQGETLFFGKTSEVFRYIETFVQDYEKQGNQVVLSKGEIVGNNVVSLSEEVHLKILETLKEGNTR